MGVDRVVLDQLHQISAERQRLQDREDDILGRRCVALMASGDLDLIKQWVHLMPSSFYRSELLTYVNMRAEQENKDANR